VRRLVILTDKTTPSGRDALSRWLKESELVAWWHWFQDAWLVVDPQNRPLSWWQREVRDKLQRGHVLVIDADGGGWAGYGKTNAFNWLKDQWKTTGPTDRLSSTTRP
jgi:hypothetical protein